MNEIFNVECLTTIASVAGLAMLAFGAFTHRQKEWIRERDNNKCQGNNASMRGGHKGGLQVHHIEPQLYGYTNGKVEADIDTPDNALTLCEGHHVGGSKEFVHQDQWEYEARYRAGDKEAYHEMQNDRKAKAQRGEAYWNTRFDSNFRKLADNGNQKMKRKGKIFPPHNHHE